ncbi:MAG: PilT/PilU family type 4a pilus ATPase [Planctomycetota bacterium]
MEQLERLMVKSVERGASDLHLSAGHPPFIRSHGELERIEGEAALSESELETFARGLMNARQWQAFAEKNTIDLARSSLSGARFRINVYQQHTGIAISMRRIEAEIQDLDFWNLPQALGRLSQYRDGLVIVTGPTGSGKSTTLASLLSRITQQRSCHVITVEDPIEYVHRSHLALVHQRELHTDVQSFAQAVRSAMREDPDVLLIGEMRDLETMRAAITAAETGHLVFSTLHTGDAVGAIDRLVGMFPSTEQDSIRHQLSMVLRAVVAQRLLPRTDGLGRLPAVELLAVNTAVAHLVRSGRSDQIYSLMEAGASSGMRTMEQDLARLTARRLVPEEEARKSARNASVFEDWLRSERGGYQEEGMARPW